MSAASRFWAGVEAGELRAPWCPACDDVVWYPRPACPRCLGTELEERVLPGRGVVRSASTVQRTQTPALAPEAPFGIVLVELEGGTRMVAWGDAEPGSRVEAGYRAAGGRTLPVFS